MSGYTKDYTEMKVESTACSTSRAGARRKRLSAGPRARLVPRRFLWVTVAFIALFTLGPFLWLVSSSFQTMSELLSIPPHLIPHRPTLENFARLFSPEKAGVSAMEGSTFLAAITNSVVVSSWTTIIALVLGTPAAYSFARLRLPWKRALLIFILALTMLPSMTVIIPLYVLGQKLGLLNTRLSLIIAYTTFGLPFVVWIMNGYFSTIPKELEDAAMIDGCTRASAFLRIAVPLSAPGLAATAIFTFLAAWDEFIFALVFTSTYSAKTLPVALAEFVGRFSIDWGLMTTGGLVATLPPVVIALVLQKYLITGLTSGAVKS